MPSLSGSASVGSIPLPDVLSKYTVVYESGYYHLYTRNSASVISSSSFKTVMEDNAINGLTTSRKNPEKIKVVGNITPDNTVGLADKLVLDLREAHFDIPNAFAKPIFDEGVVNALANWSLTDLTILGGVVNGNLAGQAAAAEFLKWTCANSPEQLHIYDLRTYDVYGYPLNFVGGMGDAIIDGCFFGGHNSNCGGLSLTDFWDSALHNNMYDVWGKAMLLNSSCRTSHFTNQYSGGGKITLDGAYNNQFLALSQQDGYEIGVELKGAANGNTFIGGRNYGNSAVGDLTTAGFVLKGTAHGNTIMGVNFPDNSPAATQKYTIEEQESADYNFDVYNIRAAAVGAAHLIGANSQTIGALVY